ncbi:MAG: DUF2384 domain-containing protein [Hormoscilla sp. SP5CHS1]|nr:DUF2384 domain-containing protein [Hormoscilla sp. SP12CHS1]MBC6453471.1 DUF2384 domain-containing protein [Hormoscilla sp. SP5CHS1]
MPRSNTVAAGNNKVYEILGVGKNPQGEPTALSPELKIVNSISEGFPIVSVGRVAQECGISEAQLAAFLGTSDRDIERRKQENKPLDSIFSDRLYRIARILARNADTARNWLKRPNRALSGAIPFGLLDTDVKTQQVDELLKKIEYGVHI